ncbi:FAD-dependent monooxygenase [Thermodesulfobacteriota bacterium]
MLDFFDVTIVGAGPSGSTLGYYLSEKGFKVLIIEKKKLPRYKPCGGGITQRASNLLPFDFDDVVEDYSLTAKILFNNIEVLSKDFDSPIVSMVMRDKFDYFLINKAKEKGVVVKDKNKFLSIEGDPGSLTDL